MENHVPANPPCLLLRIHPYLSDMLKNILFASLLLGFLTANAQPQRHFFHVLYDSKDALQCRVDLIQQAKKEILLSYYILKDDLSGTVLLNLLAEASAKRGVIVQILVDRKGAKISAPMQSFMQKHGIVTHYFFLKNKGLKKYYHSLHEKVFLVDREYMIVGGRNLKDNYYGLSDDFNFFDYDVLVTGDTLLEEARLHFYTLWGDERLSSPYPKVEVAAKRAAENLIKIQAAITGVRQKRQIEFDTRTNWLSDARATTSPAGFIKDDFYVKKGRRYVLSDVKSAASTQALISFVDSAKYSICLENPYFVPTKTWNRAFRAALKRGVKVRVLTNSIQSCDLLIRQAAYLNRRKKMVRHGLEIWEYQGPDKWHAKSMVVDEAVVVIGSYNIHLPSEKYNTEVAVWQKNKKTAQVQLEVMANNIDNALHIGPNNKAIPRPEKNFPGAGFGLRAKTFILRYSVSAIFGWMM